VIDDLWGENQAIMNSAGLTPNGITEADGASQRLTAMQRISGHPGEIIGWVGATADPSAIGVRMLLLTGQGILRSAYADLDTVTYVGDSANPTAPAFYRADDAAGTSRNIAGIYLILPDFRGYVLRGLDLAGTVDPDGASRAIGDTQADTLQNHNHNVSTVSGGSIITATWAEATYWVYTSDPGGGAVSNTFLVPTSGNILRAVTMQNPIAAPLAVITPGLENRMVNAAVHWCIRY
jgi:hypothetical protein